MNSWGKYLSVFGVLALSLSAHAAWHTLDESIRSVQKNHVNRQILVYKAKDLAREMSTQRNMLFLSRQQFNSLPLFRSLSFGQSELQRYFVRHFSLALNEAEAIETLRQMYADPNIEYAYFEVTPEDAIFSEPVKPPQATLAGELDNFEAQQFYLNPAPEGVDARFGWTQPGGTGLGIRIIDVETGWHVEHFEFGSVFYDNQKNAVTDHGTAVWGEVAARPDTHGVTGIAYDVNWGIAGNGFSGVWQDYPETIASVIESAVVELSAGDLLIIEQHAPLVDDYGPIEYFEPVFKILQMATAKGIHCVAAAGNGYSNLDDAKYNRAFDMAVRDSGCILVGASESPLSNRVRQRADFSNYGARVDAFGYGFDVVSSGYGDLWDGTYQNKLATYTRGFSGTSSATPIVAGAVASVLGMAKQRGVMITPAQMRAALRVTGSPQQGDASQRIGNLPDLRALSAHFFGSAN